MKLYIIPGGGETIKDPGYQEIISGAHNKSYDVEVLNLQLPNNNLNKLLAEAVHIIGCNNGANTSILGFSSGALIAHTLASKIAFHAGYFCSLATLFNTDIPPIGRAYEQHFGHDTLRQMRKKEYGRSQATHNYFFTGDSEGWKIPKRSRELSKKVSGELITVPNTGHDLTTTYIKEIVSRL